MNCYRESTSCRDRSYRRQWLLLVAAALCAMLALAGTTAAQSRRVVNESNSEGQRSQAAPARSNVASTAVSDRTPRGTEGRELQPKPAAVADKSAATAGGGDDCKSAVRHYELGDIPDGEIVKMFESLAQRGDVRGTLWLARLHYKGLCSLPKSPKAGQDMAKAVVGEVSKLAEKGDSEAQFLIACAYHEGLAVAMDLTAAVKWYRKAVSSGHVMACNNLGAMLAVGHGTDPNIDEARRLFAHAAAQGSKPAARNMSKFGDDNRDDTGRLAYLRSVPLVQALGMQKEEGIAFLVKSSLISNPKTYEESTDAGKRQYFFPADGIVLEVGINGRIIDVEGHAKRAENAARFRGDIPLGVTWDDTRDSAREKLGNPDDSGPTPSDHGHGMAYRIENVFFVLSFSYSGERKLKLWRVYERWATKYPAGQPPERNKR